MLDRRLQVPAQLGREVTHACPQCPIGAPSALCSCCGGHGSISTQRLAQWQLTVLAGVPEGLR